MDNASISWSLSPESSRPLYCRADFPGTFHIGSLGFHVVATSEPGKRKIPNGTRSCLLHVTDRLSNMAMFVQISWMDWSRTNDLQYCRYYVLVRILPEEPRLRSWNSEAFTAPCRSLLKRDLT